MLTLEQIRPYLTWKNNGSLPDKYVHDYYKETKGYRLDIEQIFGEKYPKYLNDNRPNEREGHREYRKKIYKNKWKHLPRRVSEALDYIHQADDFGITFPELPEGVKEGFTLEDYTGKTLTPDGGMKDWFFKNVPDAYLKDPNAVIATVFTEVPRPTGEFFERGLFEPRPVLFPCDNVIAHQKGRFAALLAPERNIQKDPSGLMEDFEGRIIHFFDDESYTAAFEIRSITDQASGKYIIDWQIVGIDTTVVINETTGLPEEITELTPILHNCQHMPAYKIGKNRAKYNFKREELYDSFFEGVFPSIKEAQQVQNDMELERVLHVTSQEWRRKSAMPKCSNPKCVAGVVYERDFAGAITQTSPGLNGSTCPTCKGTGLMPSSGSSLELLMVNDGVDDSKIGSATDPRPAISGAPGGYIERNIKPLETLTKDHERISGEIYETLNMRFIKMEPNDTSGTSKRYDREEMYRELNTQSAHLLGLMKNMYQSCDGIRYTNHPYVGKQVPEIMVPVRFNLENAELTREELNDAKDKEYDQAIVDVLEKKFLEYNAGVESLEYNQYETRLKLDPFRSMNSDEKNMVIGVFVTHLKEGKERDNAIENIAFSIMFNALIIRAEQEVEGFYELPMKERNKKLREFMKDVYGGTRPVIIPVNANTGVGETPQTVIKPAANVQDMSQTDKNQAGFQLGK